MEKITPRLVPITPHELYLQRVKSTYDNMRKTREGMSYTPVQFGGLFGQTATASAGVVLELTEFEVK